MFVLLLQKTSPRSYITLHGDREKGGKLTFFRQGDVKGIGGYIPSFCRDTIRVTNLSYVQKIA